MNTLSIGSDFGASELAGTAHSSRPSAAPPTNALSKLMESDESDNDTPPVQLPRANLLASLRRQAIEDSSESEDSIEDAEAIYERVKRTLMSASDQSAPPKEPQQAPKPTNDGSSEDEEDIPIRRSNARRPVSRREDSSTPPASPAQSVRSRQSSLGLFCTPNASPVSKRVTMTSPAAQGVDDPAKPHHNKDFEERVKRIRAERLAAKKQKQQRERRSNKSRASEDSDADSDGENGRRLTQLTRPTRRAGKKAMEDIAREQQRISRNMQLTHQAKTKKKYGVKDLFSKFGLAEVGSELVPASAMPTPDASSVLASSDVEADPHADTPPTSPPTQADDMDKAMIPSNIEPLSREESTAASRVVALSPSVSSTVNKGKGRAPEYQHVPLHPLIEQSQMPVHNPPEAIQTPVSTEMVELSDSDDDIKPAQPRSRFPVFDRLPQSKLQEAPSILHLRHLAHLTSPGKNNLKGRKSLSMAELQTSLGQKAREQAHKERQEKIEDLRRRGIHIETEEEREKHQLEIEDLVAQFEAARQEDLKLSKLERQEAKNNGEKMDELPSSDESEDDDYVGSGEEDVGTLEEVEDAAELELSGSEEEDIGEADDEEELDEEEDQADSNGLLDDAAEESEEERLENPLRGEQPDEEDLEEEVLRAPTRRQNVKRPRKAVIDDDDEDSGAEAQSKSANFQLPTILSQTQEDDAMAAFGFVNEGGALGLTQMFAGTMANLESRAENAHPLDTEPEQNSLDFLRSLPGTQPGDPFDEASNLLVPNSQMPISQQNDTQLSLGISQLVQSSPAFTETQLSQAFEPTQDAGFALSRSPAGLAPPPSTIDTVMMPIAESPVAKKKGKLRQRKRIMNAEFSDADEDMAASRSGSEKGEETAEAVNAFNILKKAATKQKRNEDNFNKKTSWARDAVEEQAEESEDEYAGVGGASDEDSGEDDEELAQMIDTGDVKVDERKIAAYYADKAKAEDAKNINQLYKDLMSGGLRKQRGGDGFDVSDPEDEIEQRRRKKRMEFHQMTKALVSDERIGEIAQNPKKSAFFHTLADHFDDQEYAFLDAPEMAVNVETSLSQSDENNEGDVTVPDSQTEPVPNTLKRKATDSPEKENRPPPHYRRTALADSLSRRPMTMADVQHSVSELLEDAHIMVPESQYSASDSEVEIEQAKPAPRRQIIDRLGASRSTTTSETAADGNLAFHAPAAGSVQPGFRVPTLIRRATSNFSTVSTSSSGASTPIEGSGVRRGGTGRSNIHAQAREAERRAALDKVDKKRKETLKKKVGKARGQRSVLGRLDAGFE